jgi:hypothetical protein
LIFSFIELYFPRFFVTVINQLLKQQFIFDRCKYGARGTKTYNIDISIRLESICSIKITVIRSRSPFRSLWFDNSNSEIKEVNIDPNDFILLKKPSSARNSLSSIEGVLVKESPAVLVFWTTDRYCTLNDH